MTYGAETVTLTKWSAENLRIQQRKMERASLGVKLSDRFLYTFVTVLAWTFP